MSALRLLIATGAFVIWSIAFVVLYAGYSVGCEVGLDRNEIGGINALTLTLAGLWLAHLVALGGMQWYGIALWRRTEGQDAGLHRFLAATTCLLSASGIVALIFLGFPLLLTPPCL